MGGVSVGDEMRRTTFPGSHRHHGPPLAGFAVSGLRYRRKRTRHGKRAVQCRILVLSLIRAQASFQRPNKV